MSNKRIAVFAGTLRTAIPQDRTSRDHIVEQLIPTNSWSYEYVLAVIDTVDQGWDNYFSVTALNDNCYIRLSNGTEYMLNSGNVHLYRHLHVREILI